MPDEKLEFKVNEYWAKLAKKFPWAAFIPELAQDSKGQEYLRKKGSSVIYKLLKEGDEKNGEYACGTCGSTILGASVAHPIWDGPSVMSDSGKCHYEIVPYCPKCEKRPGFNGMPIERGPKL